MDSGPTNGGPQDAAKTEIIHVFTNHEAAELAAANLQAHGIESWITCDDGGGMMPYLTLPEGVRLLVQSSDAEAARALLET